jgi:hypothetical protein
MKMREVKSIKLPAGKLVDLEDSGYHLMLIGLKAPLKAGDSVPLTLNIELADKSIMTVEAKAEVNTLYPNHGSPGHKHGSHH